MKTTKRALFSSVVALILCFSMLVGTTFAWFTDEVKSDVNKIVAGNLDVDVVTTADDKSIENQSVLFDEIKLWEPGVVAYENITVKNLGTLALKYQLSVNFNKENYVVEADGTVTDNCLADVLMVSVIEETIDAALSREEVLTKAGEGVLLSELVKSGELESLKNQNYAIIIWWPQSANDDTFNINNGKTTTDGEALHINLGVKLFATQMQAEMDSFGKDYDQPAPIVSVPVARPDTAQDMALKGAEDVVIALPAAVVDALSADVEEIGMAVSEPVIDDTNNTVNFESVELVDQNGNVIDLEALNLNEKITVTLPLPAGHPFDNGDTVIVYHDGEYMATAIVNNNAITYEVAHLCEITIATVEVPEVEDNTVKIGTAAELFGFAQNVNSGNEYYAGKTVVLTADIDLKNAAWTPIGSATKDHGFMGNFDGNGYTISNLTINNIELDADGYAYAGFFGVTEGAAGAENVIKDLTIKNVTINTTGHIVAAAIAYPYYTTVENITVCGDIAITGGDYTSGVLAYTRRCTTASNLTISGNASSYIKGANTVGGVLSDIQSNGGIVVNYSNFSASGLTITGNKCVGGISGIIGGQTLNGATVENVALVCSDAHVGIVSGAFDSKPVINDATYKNVTGAIAVAGVPYDSSKGGALVLDGETYVSVATADELVAALEAGNNVLFSNNIKIDPANMSNAYGKTGINVKNGQTIDGNGYTLNIQGAGGTWDSGINTTGGLIKNITVTGSFRGIFINHNSTHSEKVVLENVILEGVVYTISCDQGLYQGIEATNCTFNGWTSFAKTAGEAKFVNCSFGEGSGYKYCRPYSDTEFVNCTFSEGYAVDTTRATVTFTNCTNPNG